MFVQCRFRALASHRAKHRAKAAAATVLQKAWRTHLRVEQQVRDALSAAIGRRNAAIEHAEKADLEERCKQLQFSALLSDARRVFGWKHNDSKVVEMATLLATLHQMGACGRAQALLELIELLITDAIGRRRAGKAMQPRHMVITGAIGTGKRTVAIAITKVLSLLEGQLSHRMEDHNIEDCGASTPDPKLQQLTSSLKQICDGGSPGCRSRKVVHIRVTPELKLGQTHKKVSAWLEELTSKGDVAILTGQSKDVEKLLGSCLAIKKRSPRRIDLAPLSQAELAHVSLRVAKRQGLVVQRAPGVLAGTEGELMELIVSETYTKEQIKAVNLYNASEMVDRAISQDRKSVV